MIDRDYWFAKKDKKFLHNIDTFYYSVKLCDDLTQDGNAPNVQRFRRVVASYQNLTSGREPFRQLPAEYALDYVRKPAYSYFYNFWLQLPEQFDICIAPVVPPSASKIASVTSEIIVQIRSKMLWELGATLAFEKSYEYVKAFCDVFNFKIAEVKENRVDYCWHTNAIQDPESYFQVERLSKMQVSRFRRVTYQFQLTDAAEKGFENDYIALGRRSDKCFLRIYLKTKEVVEQGYKSWFFYQWFFNGLISRYDVYVLEKAYKEKNWRYCDIARLQFALEYDDTLSDAARSYILAHIEAKAPDYTIIAKLANKYTPRLTKILNVEFQTMRRMSKSFQLLQVRDNSVQGPAKRIYDYLDNRRLITESLTHSTFRLVNPGTDTNKSRADYTDFWKRLRGTKQVDVNLNRHQLKLVRDYSSILDAEVRKTKAVRAVSNFAMLLTKNAETTIYEDTAEMLAVLNDNDLNRLFNYKQSRYHIMQYDDDFDVGLRPCRRICVTDDTGEIYENTGYD